PTEAATLLAFNRVSCPEPARDLVIVPRPQIVQAEVAIELLAAVFEVVGGGAGASDQAAEGVVLIRVRDRSCAASQETDVAVAVVTVEAGRPGRAVELVLADPLQAVT